MGIAEMMGREGRPTREEAYWGWTRTPWLANWRWTRSLDYSGVFWQLMIVWRVELRRFVMGRDVVFREGASNGAVRMYVTRYASRIQLAPKSFVNAGRFLSTSGFTRHL